MAKFKCPFELGQRVMVKQYNDFGVVGGIATDDENQVVLPGGYLAKFEPRDYGYYKIQFPQVLVYFVSGTCLTLDRDDIKKGMVKPLAYQDKWPTAYPAKNSQHLQAILDHPEIDWSNSESKHVNFTNLPADNREWLTEFDYIRKDTVNCCKVWAALNNKYLEEDRERLFVERKQHFTVVEVSIDDSSVARFANTDANDGLKQAKTKAEALYQAADSRRRYWSSYYGPDETITNDKLDGSWFDQHWNERRYGIDVVSIPYATIELRGLGGTIIYLRLS